MTSELLIDLAWKGTALALMALVAGCYIRRCSATVRSYVYLLAFACLALLPLSAFLPQWSPLPPEVAFVPAPELSMDAVTPTVEELPATDWVSIATWVWFGGSLSALLALAIGLLRTRNLIRSCAPSNMNGRTPVLIAPTEGPAFTVGLRRPVIVLPANAVDWSDERTAAVIRHEQAHIDRKDWARLILMRLVRSLYWPNPLVWALEAQAVLAGEQACDDQVLLAGINPAGYAMHLLEIARTASNGYTPVAQAATGSWLESRLRAILNSSGQRGGLPMRLKVLCLLLALATVGIVAPVTANQEPAKPVPVVAAVAPVSGQSAPAVVRASAGSRTDVAVIQPATPAQAPAAVATVSATRPTKRSPRARQNRSRAVDTAHPTPVSAPAKLSRTATSVAGTPVSAAPLPAQRTPQRVAPVVAGTAQTMTTFERPALAQEAPSTARAGSPSTVDLAQTRAVPATAGGGTAVVAPVDEGLAVPARVSGGPGQNLAPVTTTVRDSYGTTSIVSGSGSNAIIDAPAQRAGTATGGGGSNAVLAPAQTQTGSGKRAQTVKKKQPLKKAATASSSSGSGRGSN